MSSSPLSPAPSQEPKEKPIVLGVCSMDIKARSKAMREILTRVVERENGAVEVKIFGDKVILDEDITHWPSCNVLISFFSTDFPLPKAIAYTQMSTLKPPPIVINDLPMQSVLWDRRLVLAVLDHIGVPTPRRVEVSRDGGPIVGKDVAERVQRELGLTFGPWTEGGEGVVRGTDVRLREDGDAIIVDGKVLEKPFVEKPVSGEDHNVYIYHRGGGGRRLFRKVGNKSSEQDPELNHPRTDGSFVYEEFINVENSEDIKIYTIGPTFTHAETRKSPVVDGLVQRNLDGKEIRFITKLSEDEKGYAKRICEAFGQMVCGFDLLRCVDEGGEGKGRSLVIDVNGWSFVKGNHAYYDSAADILAKVCQKARNIRTEHLANLPTPIRAISTLSEPMPPPAPVTTSKLKASVTVFRHADRTPKMKWKFSFSGGEPWSQPFVSLLRGHREEIILRESVQLDLILDAVAESMRIGCPPATEEKMRTLQEVLARKKDMPGTKAQLKPTFSKVKAKKETADDDGSLTETESRIRQWIAHGEMAGDAPSSALPAVQEETSTPHERSSTGGSLMGPPLTSNVTPTGSGSSGREKNPYYPPPADLEKVQLVVKWGGESTHAARYQSKDLGEGMKKDFTVMNSSILKNVKVYTSSEKRVVNTADIFARALLDKDTSPASSSLASSTSQTQADNNVPLVDHLIQRRDLLDDSNAAKELMEGVKKKLKILLRPGESDRRPGLFWPKELKKEPVQVVREVIEMMTELRKVMTQNFENGSYEKINTRWCSGDTPMVFRERWEKLFEDWVGVKKEKFDPSRVSELYDSLKYDALHNRTFLFAIFDPQGGKDLNGARDRSLHELYARAKLLFDLVAPQEYGIEPEEKEEIGILTSLPLLRKVVEDLQLAAASDESHASFYFTKESHIYTFVNLVIASGLPMLKKKIPELDYASHITFELYERSVSESPSDSDSLSSAAPAPAKKSDKQFSLRLSVSEGAHSPAALDSSVDARHSLNVAQRRKITTYIPLDIAIKHLSKHFDRGQFFSTTPLEGTEIFFGQHIADEAILPLSKRDVPSSASSDRTDQW